MRRFTSDMSRLRWGIVDEETQHYARVFKTKRARLNELEVQAAAIGEYNVPPQIAMEIGSLKEELGMVTIAMESPARADVGDEIGPRGRFVVNYQQNQDIKKSIAALTVQFEQFVTTSQEWRVIHRNWILIIGLVVILILVAVVALVTYLITKGAL